MTEKLPLLDSKPAVPGGRAAAVAAGTLALLCGLLCFLFAMAALLAKSPDLSLPSRILMAAVLGSIGVLAASIGRCVLRGRPVVTRRMGWIAAVTVILAFGFVAPTATIPRGTPLEPLEQLGFTALLAATLAVLIWLWKRTSKRRESQS